MQRQNGHGDIFGHGGCDARFDHTDHPDMRRQDRQVELINTRANRKQHLKIGQRGNDFLAERPGDQIAHVLWITDVGPAVKRHMRHVAGKNFRPCRAALGISAMDDGGAGPLGFKAHLLFPFRARFHAITPLMVRKRGRRQGTR
jgi:hypothetical protein